MRRRKPRVVWIPQTNANALSIGTSILNDTVYQLGAILTLPAGSVTGTTTVEEIPLCLDAQVAIEDTGASLADIESSGYRLRRVVGKIWIQCGQSDFTSTARGPMSAIVTAGIMVRRTDTLTGSSIALGSRASSCNPGLIENTMDPWVWRRSWIVGDNAAVDNLAASQPFATSNRTNCINSFPVDNYSVYAGGNSDGPHVDQKTARVISQEERLFLDVSATVLAESTNPPGDSQGLGIAFITDLRVLGTIRTNSGNRRNASR